jgi:ATP-dependent DNA ligase
MNLMEAESVAELPRGAQWQYEPKWDGFRCLLIRDGERVKMQSKSGRDLVRYFPEVASAACALNSGSVNLDGELVIERDEGFSFDALLQRIHPAASRVKRLAEETPATFIAFDLLRLRDEISPRFRSPSDGPLSKSSRDTTSKATTSSVFRRRAATMPMRRDGLNP